jgi:hypothetical protein
MSLKLKKQDKHLEILDGVVPDSEEFRVFTEEEVLQFEGWKQWMSLSEEHREDMMQQTQSAAYQEWMEEKDWDKGKVEESQVAYGDKRIKYIGKNTMNKKVKAHIEAGTLVLDEPLPEDLGNSEVLVSIEKFPSQPGDLRPEELAQSQTGFARSVLLDPEEDVWDHE